MSLDPLFAQAGLTDAVFWALRAAAGIGGALVGWFVSDPLTRLLYRAAFARPTPGWVLPWAKLAGAILVGLLVFFFIPLGGGPGGFGFGPGQGGGAGLGPGKGGDKGAENSSVKDKAADRKDTAGEKKNVEVTPKAAVREPVEIELLGGDRYQGDHRFYLLDRVEPAKTLDDVKEYLDRRHKEKPLEVRIYLTKRSESVGPNHPAFRRLDELIRSYGNRDAQDRIPSTVISELGPMTPGG